MFFKRINSQLSFFALSVIPVMIWLHIQNIENASTEFNSEKINLALRRTADGLLRESGDSTSRIPSVEQKGTLIWRIQLGQAFSYEKLPALLQASLDLHDIRWPYQVAVRRCSDAVIDLGYHQLDWINNKQVPCNGREFPDGCHFIEITFLANEIHKQSWAKITGFLLLGLGGLAGLWLIRRHKNQFIKYNKEVETVWLEFGNSKLDISGQILISEGNTFSLTFRETKLLGLFVNNADRLLEREFILQQVWADEGVLVGRSVDMFVSRLRKKLAADPTVGITAVHGIGYRLETGKMV